MTKLDKAVAIAMGLRVEERAGQDFVEVTPDHMTWLSSWLETYNIADRLMDGHHKDGTRIETEYFGRRWCATCEGVSAQHQDRKTAALMAFCKFKGVAYE